MGMIGGGKLVFVTKVKNFNDLIYVVDPNIFG